MRKRYETVFNCCVVRKLINENTINCWEVLTSKVEDNQQLRLNTRNMDAIEQFTFTDIVKLTNNIRKRVKAVKGYIVYRIYNTSNDKSYIGTTKNLYERLYCKLFGYYWKIIGLNNSNISRIHRAIINEGVDRFNIEILGHFSTSDEMLDSETEMITKFDSYFSGYNSTPNGKWKNRSNETKRKGVSIWITKDLESRMIPKELFSEFESRGWRRGNISQSIRKSGTKFLHNDFETIRVDESDVQAALECGYILGRGYDDPKLGRIVMTNGVETRFVKPDQVSDYLDRGYYKGKDESTKSKMRNKICITNGLVDKRILKSELEEYKLKGFYEGRKPSERSNLRYVTNLCTKEVKRVNILVLDSYLSNGWIRGRGIK